MAYNSDAFKKVMDDYSAKRSAAMDEAQKRLEDVIEKCPEIKLIDVALAGTGVAIMEAISEGRSGIEDRLERIRKNNEELQQQRADCLALMGYSRDHTEPKFECKLCKDTGYDGARLCKCFKKALTLETCRRSGIGRLVDIQTFDSYSLEYFKYSPEVFDSMSQNLEICKKYAEKFSLSSENLMLIGDTGLGKTHLSTAIAGRVIERGFDVCYDTATNIFSAFENERFGKQNHKLSVPTERYFECELLIIDDLGTEPITQFTLSALYNLINTRTMNERPILLNTNLSLGEMQKKYGDRIASRLFGESVILKFTGKDVRLQKIGIT